MIFVKNVRLLKGNSVKPRQNLGLTLFFCGIKSVNRKEICFIFRKEVVQMDALVEAAYGRT